LAIASLSSLCLRSRILCCFSQRDRLLLPVAVSPNPSMFTGLIQALGSIAPLDRDRFAIEVTSPPPHPLIKSLEIGDSIAVDGVCLTVETILANGFVATASPETLSRSRLGQLTPGRDRVNLEPALRAGSKLGGHFVSGHVDGVGQLLESRASERAWEMSFKPVPTHLEQWDNHIARYLIPKGSIAINGVSLTIVDCAADDRAFSVAVIPHTYERTNLCDLTPGSWVNLESDILGKYVDKLLGFRPSKGDEVSLDFLAEHGYV
jgi:riboflavin synthase